MIRRERRVTDLEPNVPLSADSDSCSANADLGYPAKLRRQCAGHLPLHRVAERRAAYRSSKLTLPTLSSQPASLTSLPQSRRLSFDLFGDRACPRKSSRCSNGARTRKGRPRMGRSPAPRGTRLGRIPGAQSCNFRHHAVTKEGECGDIHKIGDEPSCSSASVRIGWHARVVRSTRYFCRRLPS